MIKDQRAGQREEAGDVAVLLHAGENDHRHGKEVHHEKSTIRHPLEPVRTVGHTFLGITPQTSFEGRV